MANLHFSARLKDGKKTNGTCVAYLAVPDSTTLTQLQTALGSWLSALDGITDAAIQEAQIRVVGNLPTGLSAATGATWAASDIEQTGVFDFTNTDTPAIFGHAVPGLADAVVVAGGIDTSAGAVTAYEGVMLGTPAGGTYTTNDQRNLLAVADTFISFRKHRRQLQRSSKR